MAASTLTSKGQTTVPAEVRKALGIQPGDRIVYEIQQGRVTMRSALQAVEDLHGAFARPEIGPVDLDAAREAFETAMAQKVMEESGV